jgi:hypothetical protein
MELEDLLFKQIIIKKNSTHYISSKSEFKQSI